MTLVREPERRLQPMDALSRVTLLTETAGRRELVCGSCGYGAVVRMTPPACPMCHSSSWREVPDGSRRSPVTVELSSNGRPTPLGA